jgi:transposase
MRANDGRIEHLDEMGGGAQDRRRPTPVKISSRCAKPALALLGTSLCSEIDTCRSLQRSLQVEIVKRPDDASGFVVPPARGVAERTFSWFGRNRRLAKDYENLADTLAAFIALACIRLARA